MRARAQQRTERFLNARTRTMGIDKNFLDQQVEEKRLAKLAEKQADLDQAAYDQSILRVLESNEAKPSKIEAWHSDMTFRQHPPSVTVLKGVTIPPVGGDDRMAFIKQAETDFQDYMIIADSEFTVEEDYLVFKYKLDS